MKTYYVLRRDPRAVMMYVAHCKNLQDAANTAIREANGNPEHDFAIWDSRGGVVFAGMLSIHNYVKVMLEETAELPVLQRMPDGMLFERQAGFTSVKFSVGLMVVALLVCGLAKAGMCGIPPIPPIPPIGTSHCEPVCVCDSSGQQCHYEFICH